MTLHLHSRILRNYRSLGPGKFYIFNQRVRKGLTDNPKIPAINLARLGWGMTRVLSYQVAAAVAADELEIVLEAFEPAPLPIQVVFQSSGRVPAKVSTFVDFLSQRLGQDAALQRHG